MSDGDFRDVRDDPVWRRLGPLAWEWRAHLRASLRAVHLRDWLADADGHRTLLGAQAYREYVSGLLAGASIDDCAAAALAIDGDEASRITDAFELAVTFNPSRTHRAVLWREPPEEPGPAWVDGLPVTRPDGAVAAVLAPGTWVGDRYFTAVLPAPPTHPLQQRSGWYDQSFAVHGLLVWDAQAQRARCVAWPRDDQAWQWPVMVAHGDGWRIYGHGADLRAPQRPQPVPDLELPPEG